MINVFICEDQAEQRDKLTKVIRDYVLMENFDMEVILSDGEADMTRPIKLKVIATTFVVVITLLLGACRSEDNFTAENSYIQIQPLSGDLSAYVAEGLVGSQFTISPFGQGTVNPTFDPDDLEALVPFTGQHFLDSPDDKLEAIISNISHSSHEFVLKLFLNYEEISFRVLDEETYKTEFHFSIEGGYEITIPFVLDLELPDENYTYKLTAAFFIDPHLHAMGNDNELWWSDVFASSINLDLVFGDGGEINLSSPYNHVPIERSPHIGFWPLHITQLTIPSIDSAWGLGFNFGNQPVLQVSQGEEIELFYMASPLSGDIAYDLAGYDSRPYRYIAQNYIILSLLDWQPIKMNGKPYLFIEIENFDYYERVTDLGSFTIIAPDEPGFYDFIAILIPNATHHNTETPRPFDASIRFTIEVVE